MGIGAYHLVSGSQGTGSLQYDLANPCIIQWSMLWFSAPTSLDNGLLNDGVILEKYNEALNLPILATFTFSFWKMHTPRSCFLRWISIVLINTLERVWNLEREMKGWDWERERERLDLLFDHGVDDAIFFKSRNEGVYIFFTFFVTPEIDTKGEKRIWQF